MSALWNICFEDLNHTQTRLLWYGKEESFWLLGVVFFPSVPWHAKSDFELGQKGSFHCCHAGPSRTLCFALKSLPGVSAKRDGTGKGGGAGKSQIRVLTGLAGIRLFVGQLRSSSGPHPREALRHPAFFFQMHCETGEKITFGELKEAVDRLADSFHKRGVRKGDVVCLFAHKHIEGVVTTLAVLKLGAVITPCRPSHTGRESTRKSYKQIKPHFPSMHQSCVTSDGFVCVAGELGIQVKDSGSKVVVADEDLFGTTLAELPNMPDVKVLPPADMASDQGPLCPH